MIPHSSINSTQLTQLVRSGEIALGGNKQLRIYGTLNCKSGKRMKMGNRVFFSSEEEAIAAGYRPCGHCMRDKYLAWKNSSV